MLPATGNIGCGQACWWLSLLPFCNFHGALRFRLHGVNTARRRPRLPAYIKDMYPATHLPPLLWLTSVPASRTPSLSLLQWRCRRLQLCLYSDDGERRREAPGRSEIGGAPSRAPCQLCLCSDLADMGPTSLPLGRPTDGRRTINEFPHNTITTQLFARRLAAAPFHVTNIWSKSCGL